MKVLVVCSGTSSFLSPFVKEQMDSLLVFGITFKLYQINKKGIFGYLLSLKSLLRSVEEFRPNIIHAHYGLSGLLANMQRSVPVITTFHGTDINNKLVLIFSQLANLLSVSSIFVNSKMIQAVKKKNGNFIIPCGIDTNNFFPIPMLEARRLLNIDTSEIIILFSSAFDRLVKNYALAKIACNLLEKTLNREITILELKGYDRIRVNLLLNAANCALLTSTSEGSPQFIKEAMACNCPLVSTDVGDVRWLIGDTEGCFISDFSYREVSEKIKEALCFGKKTNARDRIFKLGLDSACIAQKLFDVYNIVINKTKC